MFYAKIRLPLVALFFLLGIILQIQLGWAQAWYLYLASFLLLLTHFLFGTVWQAFSKLHQGKLREAEKLLYLIKKPAWLLKSHRAYYHFTKGMIALQRKMLPESENHLLQALELGLRSNNDRALTSLNLAHIYFLQNQFPQARTYLHQVKSFKSNDLLIKENSHKLEQALNAREN